MRENMSPKPFTPQQIARHIRTIEGFPKPGISFKDISPLLAEPEAFGALVEMIAQKVKSTEPNVIAGMESRGFIIGIAVAQHLGLPFVPIRKEGKLPGDVVKVSYDLEYGSACLEMQRDAFRAGSKVAIVDDLLATGGTAAAAAELVETIGGKVSGLFFAIVLPALNGKSRLEKYPVHSILSL